MWHRSCNNITTDSFYHNKASQQDLSRHWYLFGKKVSLYPGFGNEARQMFILIDCHDQSELTAYIHYTNCVSFICIADYLWSKYLRCQSMICEYDLTAACQENRMGLFWLRIPILFTSLQFLSFILTKFDTYEHGYIYILVLTNFTRFCLWIVC